MGLKEKLLKEKIDSMKQLDRIELQNKIILQQNTILHDGTFYILGIVSLFFSISYAFSTRYLMAHGINVYYHLQGVRIFSIVALGFFFLHFLIILINLSKARNFKEEDEKFIEDHS